METDPLSDKVVKSQSLQKILSYKGLQPFLSREEWDDLGKKIGIDTKELGRTWGIDIQDSFYLLALTYPSVDSVILLEENIAQLSNNPTVDCILVLKDGEKICVEIKASQKDEWKITCGRLSRQEEFASKLGMKLYYAVFLRGYWGLFPSEKVRQLGFKIDLSNLFANSQFNQIFDPRLIRIPKGLLIRNHYSLKGESQKIGLEHPIYGFPIKYELVFNDIIIDLSDPMDLMGIACIESGLQSKSIDKTSDELHIAIKEAGEILDVYDYNILLAPIYSTVGSVSGQYYDSSTFVSAILDQLKGQKIGFKEIIDKGVNMITKLVNKGIPFQIIKWSDVSEWKFQK